MTLSISAQRCDYDTYNITISSPVEADGGDHYCVIDCSSRVSLDIALDAVPLDGRIGMLFTNAGETYVLSVKNKGDYGNTPVTLSWPYQITAVYAPAWAKRRGVIACTLVFNLCDSDADSGWLGKWLGKWAGKWV